MRKKILLLCSLAFFFSLPIACPDRFDYPLETNPALAQNNSAEPQNDAVDNLSLSLLNN